MSTRKLLTGGNLNTRNATDFCAKGLRYKWHILTQTPGRQKFLVEMDDLGFQPVEIDVNYLESGTACACINLLGRKSRITFDLTKDLDRVIRQRGCIRGELSFFRSDLICSDNLKLNFQN
jgi:hypothetical protein